jgi:phosphopantetheine--protein transferase-like protein
MNKELLYDKYIELINKEDFMTFFLSCNPEEWFSDRELEKFKFPENARSLAGRYLIKKSICNYLNEYKKIYEIEILNDDLGKPEVFLGYNIRQAVELKGIKNIYCSISHSRNYITGMTLFCF